MSLNLFNTLECYKDLSIWLAITLMISLFPFICVKDSCQNAMVHQLKFKYNSPINTHFCTAS